MQSMNIKKEEIDIPFDTGGGSGLLINFEDQTVKFVARPSRPWSRHNGHANNLLDQLVSYYNKSLANDTNNCDYTIIEDNIKMEIKTETKVEDLTKTERMECDDFAETERMACDDVEDDEKYIDVTTEIDLQSIIDALRATTGQINTDEGDKLRENEKTVQERRVLRIRKKTTPDAGTTTAVQQKKPKKKPKNKTNTMEKLQNKKKIEHLNSHFSSLTKKRCPNNCKDLAAETNNMAKCLRCRSPFLYVCTKCNMEYKRKNSIKIHLDTKCHPRRVHSCKMCEYTSANMAHIKRHVLNLHKVTVDQLPTLFKSVSVHHQK